MQNEVSSASIQCTRLIPKTLINLWNELLFASFRAVPFLPRSISDKWEESMRFRSALSLAALFVVCFTVASWATPVPDRLLTVNSVRVPDNPSQSGKIASIGDAAFSLEVTNGQERKTIEFLVDD